MPSSNHTGPVRPTHSPSDARPRLCHEMARGRDAEEQLRRVYRAGTRRWAWCTLLVSIQTPDVFTVEILQVQRDDVVITRQYLFNSHDGVDGRIHVVALTTQYFHHHPAEVLFVIDHENAFDVKNKHSAIGKTDSVMLGRRTQTHSTYRTNKVEAYG